MGISDISVGGHDRNDVGGGGGGDSAGVGGYGDGDSDDNTDGDSDGVDDCCGAARVTQEGIDF